MIAHRLYVGTIGEGVFRSDDRGESFRRACDGMPFVECQVRALAVHPDEPRTLYLGSEQGLFVTRDGADSWQKLPAPLDGLQVWCIHQPRSRPKRLLVGTCPSALYRSEDGGQSWQQCTAQLVRECPRIQWTRVTSMASDPADADHLWAGVEIDGLHHSRDGGQTWSALGEGLTSRDIHALAVVPLPGGGRRLLATTNQDLNISEDGGRTWRPAGMANVLPWAYTRALAQKADNLAVVFLGGGDRPPGWEGLVAVSHDGGTEWGPATMPGRANSTVWAFATHPADVMLLYAASVSGQVYRSTDGGANWGKLKTEFGEIRALAWSPE
jgi:photosystem II stability/assembly factor-like uncharacterized protein